MDKNLFRHSITHRGGPRRNGVRHAGRVHEDDTRRSAPEGKGLPSEAVSKIEQWDVLDDSVRLLSRIQLMKGGCRQWGRNDDRWLKGHDDGNDHEDHSGRSSSHEDEGYGIPFRLLRLLIERSLT